MLGLFPTLGRSLRVVAVLALCLCTPAVLDIIVETANWVAGVECCADDCDESGVPCTQQCTHCVCGGHNVTLPSFELGRVVAERWVRAPVALLHASARSGHLDPPFRPPVS